MPGQVADPTHCTQYGLAELVLEQRAGRTRLTRARTRPPLVVQQALYPDDAVPDMAFVFLANPTGGLLSDDRQDISVEVRSGAKAHVTTQSATKIYTMEGGIAKQRVNLNVSGGGFLEYLPDPVIPFRGANLEQHVAITLEPGAIAMVWDVITPGRVAMGESFAYRRLSNRLAVHRHRGRPAYREAYDLAPADGYPVGKALLGATDQCESPLQPGLTLGSMLILCDAGLAAPLLDRLRESISNCAGAQAGASRLPDGNGLGVKVIGTSCAAVQSALSHFWTTARRELLGVPAPFLRKY